jgi:outer membrane lipoprotein-sorting protein
MRTVLFTLVLTLFPHSVLGDIREHGEEAAQVSGVYARIAHAVAGIETISSDFRQEKRSDMVDRVLESRGRFYYGKPDRLRWEVTEPVRMGFIVNRKKAERWRGARGRRESFPLARAPFLKVFADQVFAWITADFDELRKRYDIRPLQEDPIVLKLIPLSSQERARFEYLKIAFAAENRHVSLIEIHQNAHNFTRIRFLNTVLNEPLREDLF